MTREDRIKEYLAFMPEEAQISVEILDALGFFTAPASIKYHGNYEGGLFDHSITVARSLVELTNKLGLTWRRSRSPYLVGMFHDLCKCDNYVCDGSGNWSYSDDVINPDHGAKSALLASRLCAQAAKETREAWIEVKDAIAKEDPVLASVMVPECIYRGFCPEFKSCGYVDTADYAERLREYRDKS